MAPRETAVGCDWAAPRAMATFTPERHTGGVATSQGPMLSTHTHYRATDHLLSSRSMIENGERGPRSSQSSDPVPARATRRGGLCLL